MGPTVIAAIISGIVSLVGIFVSARTTRQEVTNKLDTNQAVMNAEIVHIKTEISEMKLDIKSHNNYAKMFNESMPVFNEKLSSTADTIKELKDEIKQIRENNNHK